MNRPFRAALAATVALAPALASAQGTITNANATYATTATPWDTTPTANYTGISSVGAATDQLFEAGWWFRLAGDTQEFFFPVPTTQNYAGNTATISWTNVGGRGFDAQLVITITGGGGIIGTVTHDMTVSNPGAAPLDIDLFVMADVDVQPTAGNDNAASVDPNGIRITHATNADFIEFRGIAANAYLVRPFSASADVAGLLSDTSLNNFDSTGLPFGPADFTGGFQWNTTTVAPGGSITRRAVLTGNTAAVPVELSSFRID